MPRRSLHIPSLHCSVRRPLQLFTTRKIGERSSAQHGLTTDSSASQSSSASSAASAVDDDSLASRIAVMSVMVARRAAAAPLGAPLSRLGVL